MFFIGYNCTLVKMSEETTHRYFVLNKPYNMVSQFVSQEKVNLLGDIDFDFPEGTHAIGRLDKLSEGLLILTTNKKVTRLLFNSPTPHIRTYMVRVLNVVSEETVEKIKKGLDIVVDEGKIYTTRPCDVEIVKNPPLPPHQLELRGYIPHTWLKITLTEGKFHQIRKMVSAVHHQCRRLVRTSIEGLELGDLPPGHIREYEEGEFFSLLKIDDYK